MGSVLRLLTAATTIVLAGCSRGSESSPEKAAGRLQPDGVTPTLTRSARPTRYNLERINNVIDPTANQPVLLSASDDLIVMGWAVDKVAKNIPAAVELAIDGNAYQAIAGLDRPDVAEFFKTPAYAKAGFQFTAPVAWLGKGKHELKLRIVYRDGTYFEAPPVELWVR